MECRDRPGGTVTTVGRRYNGANTSIDWVEICGFGVAATPNPVAPPAAAGYDVADISPENPPQSVAARDPQATTPKYRLFLPILAGATWRDRCIACAGALLGVALTYLICRLTLGEISHLPLLVAPMGATAVLLFAVPASPLAQPWSIIGGNTISAFIGIAVAKVIPDPVLASGVAVALAIAVMSLARCLHPPGGAAALLAVLGGPAVTDAGFLFALDPVAINAVLITLLGLGFHKLLRHNYRMCQRRPFPPTPMARRMRRRAPASVSARRISMQRSPISARPSTSTAAISTACWRGSSFGH